MSNRENEFGFSFYNSLFKCLEMDLDSLRDYIDYVDNYIKDETNKIEKWFELQSTEYYNSNDIKGNNKSLFLEENSIKDETNKSENWFELQFDEDIESTDNERNKQKLFLFTDEFPKILWNSVFILVYAHLEKKMIETCRNISQKQKKNQKKLNVIKKIYRFLNRKINSDEDFNSIRKKGIFKARKYLVKFIGISFPENEIFWQNIIKYNKLRNHIIHELGEVNKNCRRNRSIINYIKNHQHIAFHDFPNYFKFELTKEFVINVINDMHKFCSYYRMKAWNSKSK